MPRHLLVGSEPDSAPALHVLDQTIEQGHSRPVAQDVRVHGRDVEPALAVGDVELGLKDLVNALQ